MTQDLRLTTEFISKRIPARPSVMLILGSGLGALADEMADAVRIPFSDVPGFVP